MRKLKLDLDELAVESFSTFASRNEEGTVHARSGESCDVCEPPCSGRNTCADSCDGVCGSYYCYTDEPSCGQGSCLYTCTSCDVSGCSSCGY
jgi:hypothetical protein